MLFTAVTLTLLQLLSCCKASEADEDVVRRVALMSRSTGGAEHKSLKQTKHEKPHTGPFCHGKSAITFRDDDINNTPNHDQPSQGHTYGTIFCSGIVLPNHSLYISDFLSRWVKDDKGHKHLEIVTLNENVPPSNRKEDRASSDGFSYHFDVKLPDSKPGKWTYTIVEHFHTFEPDMMGVNTNSYDFSIA